MSVYQVLNYFCFYIFVQRILVDMPCGMVTNNSYAALTKHVLKINRNIYIYIYMLHETKLN